MKRICTVTIISFAAFLVSCAPATKRIEVPDAAVAIEAEKQREIALKSLLEKQIRISRIAYPLMVNATDLCPEAVEPRLGIGYANKYVFPREFQDAAIRLYGVGDPLQITVVHEKSPASVAGLESGDILISLANKSVPVGDGAVKEFRDYLRKEIKAGQEISIAVQRGEERILLQIVPVAACGFPVVLSQQDDVNAFADGQNVVITKGMVRFVETDQELALVIAHEMAHNAMGHVKKKMGNYALGSIFDIIAAAYGINTQSTFGNISAQAYSQEFEAEADHVGLYIMAKSGLEIENAQNFWRRLAAENPDSIKRSRASSHPSTSERFVEIEATVTEITRKKELGQPLTPALKSSKKAKETEEEVEEESGQAKWWERFLKGDKTSSEESKLEP